jgi:hypothetical protein
VLLLLPAAGQHVTIVIKKGAPTTSCVSFFSLSFSLIIIHFLLPPLPLFLHPFLLTQTKRIFS